MKKYFIYIAILAIAGVGFYQKIYIPKHTFETLNPTRGNMFVKVNGVGNVGSKELYKIGSIYGGRVLDFKIEEGDFVKRGEIIAKIDYVDLADRALELEATIKKLKSDIKSLEIEKQSAQVRYLYQDKILNKNRKLFEKHAISELDFAKFRSDRDVAKLQVESISSKIDSLHSQMAQIDASLKGLKERLSRYTIKSPVDGYVVRKLLSNYAIITPNQTLIEIVNPKDVWVETHIDTRISGSVKVGDRASIKLRSSSKEFAGVVSNIKPVNNSVTNEREIDVSFNNLPIPFYLEEQAIVDIDIKELQDITKIPNRAIGIYKEQEGVWVVVDKTIHFRAIKILAHSDHSVATKDIDTKDRLVIPNPNKKSLSDGMKIYHD
ncbi:Probable RND efflux membrane fusion protein [hydrothermal vent metagenome]|uniref:Probable RND efflux membrane fusion protein n=1 Tax=hydrothermal vent metagenome TaxID=652676 RepID=A0A1W1BIV8_9ZZZZ